MDEKTIGLIAKLADAVGQTSGQVVEHYTKWFIVSSVVWMAVGFAFLGLAWKIKGSERNFNYDVPDWVVKAVILVIGLLIVAHNMTNLMAPEGIALHQLIKDLRG